MSSGNYFCQANTNANTLSQASPHGGLGTCVINDSHMCSWLFEHWDCSPVGDDDVVDNEVRARTDRAEAEKDDARPGEQDRGRDHKP